VIVCADKDELFGQRRGAIELLRRLVKDPDLLAGRGIEGKEAVALLG
jgi:hypothetical protein